MIKINTTEYKQQENKSLGNCARCHRFTSLDEHHIVKRSSLGHNMDTIWVCRPCHMYIENHPTEAKEEGYSLRYIDTRDYEQKYRQKSHT